LTFAMATIGMFLFWKIPCWSFPFSTVNIQGTKSNVPQKVSLEQNLVEKSKNNNIESQHVFLSQHAVKSLQSMTQRKKKKNVTWWCGMLIHVILPWDFIMSMPIF
jgi:hypothetical protein